MAITCCGRYFFEIQWNNSDSVNLAFLKWMKSVENWMNWSNGSVYDWLYCYWRSSFSKARKNKTKKLNKYTENSWMSQYLSSSKVVGNLTKRIKKMALETYWSSFDLKSIERTDLMKAAHLHLLFIQRFTWSKTPRAKNEIPIVTLKLTFIVLSLVSSLFFFWAIGLIDLIGSICVQCAQVNGRCASADT